MAEKYIEEEQILDRFAKQLDASVFESLVESFFEDPVLLYDDDGNVNMEAALNADYFQRAAFGEFSEVEAYLSELCIQIEDDSLRDELIDCFDLDRDYIESEL